MKALKYMTALLLLVFLQGCWGSRETDEIAYVLTMGMDKGPENNVIVTFQIANPKVIVGGPGGGGGGGEQEKPLLTLSTIAPLPVAAFNLMNVQRSRQLSLLQTNAFIISEELARSGLGTYITPLNRYRETRGTAFFYICRGKASEFMEKNTPELETTPSKQYELISRAFRLHSLAPVVQFQKFYSATKSEDSQPVAPLVGINEEGLNSQKPSEPDALGDYLAGKMPSNRGETQFIGTAVFLGDKMVGTLDGNESRYLNMLTGEMYQSFIIIADPIEKNKPVGLSIKQAQKPTITVSTAGHRPTIREEIFIEPEIVGLPSGINYENNVKIDVLEKKVTEVISGGCQHLIARTQEEFRSDICGYGRYARKNFLTLQQWKDYDWLEKYPLAEVEVKVNVGIRRTGLMLKTAPVD
jgi:spore germination protein KC